VRVGECEDVRVRNEKTRRLGRSEDVIEESSSSSSSSVSRSSSGWSSSSSSYPSVFPNATFLNRLSLLTSPSGDDDELLDASSRGV